MLNHFHEHFTINFWVVFLSRFPPQDGLACRSQPLARESSTAHKTMEFNTERNKNFGD